MLEITEACTGEKIKESLLEYMKFVDLDPKKMSCVVRDGASNIKCAAKKLDKYRFTLFCL